MSPSSELLATERASINEAYTVIIRSLQSGDLTVQRAACEKLGVLAENYFRRLFPESVSLIARLNTLDRESRQGLLTKEQQKTTISEIIIAATELAMQMIPDEAVSRFAVSSSADSPEDQEVRELDKKRSQLAPRPTIDSQNIILDEDSESDRVLLDWLVKRRGEGQLLRAASLSKSYGGPGGFNLSGISLTLRRGDVLGVVGVNASGKTTLLRMLLGEIAVSGGRLEYPAFGQGPEKFNWPNIKRKIAYVPQNLPWWPGRVYENLRYVASIYRKDQTGLDTYLDLLLRRYGLDAYREATWGEISGGFKTRFEIVRALVSDPEIIILDEPLAYLDILNQQVVLRQLRQLAKTRLIGIIVTSQQLYEIESIADRLLVLDGGITRYSGRVSGVRARIKETVIEFQTRTDLQSLRQGFKDIPAYRDLLATETGYIAVFSRTATHPDGSGHLTFNEIVGLVSQRCASDLIGIRDISSSCRIFFEPRLAESLGLGDEG